MRKIVQYASFGLAILFAAPLSLGPVTGLYVWTSPFLFLNTALSFQPLVVLHVLALAALLMIFLRPRWYCKWLCPTGVICDVASQKSQSKIRLIRFPHINKIILAAALVMAILGAPLLTLLDPLVIFHIFFDAFRNQSAALIALKISGLLLIVMINFIIPHVWCQRLCPLGGLQDVTTWIRKIITRKAKPQITFQSGRRAAIGTLAGLALGLVAQRVIASPKEKPLRPPGAVAEDELKAICLRCGSCGKACPTHIIRSSFNARDVAGLMTPKVSFEMSYCLADCTLCGSVCPSGAIKKFAQDQKKTLVIGMAKINVQDCLLTQFKECDLCKKYCEYDAVEIQGNEFPAFPNIVEDRCVGCGACVVVCPERAIEVEVLELKI